MGEYDGSNTTGFVSPAADGLEGPVDLAEVLDLRRPHRYPVRVVGDALNYRGICDGDVLIACTATPPTPGRVVIAMVSGEVIVAVLARDGKGWRLRPRDSRQGELPIRPDDEIWAVVTGLVRPKV